MNSQCVVGLMCALAVVISARAAAAPPPTSLNDCQNAVKAATGAFIKNKVTAIGTCLQAVSTQIVKNNAVDAHAAASACVTQFRRLKDSRGLGKSLPEKLTASILRKCAPGQPGVTHTLADIIGTGAGVPQPLQAEDINAWCTHFGGDGSIDTLQEWTDCLTAAAECSVDAALATQFPRVLEWLALVKTSMQGLTAPSGDSNRISDAIAGLDAVKGAIDGPDDNNVVSLQCGGDCGDGAKNGSEACDGTDLGGASCTSLGYATGTLSCTASCGFNTSGCDCRTATGTAAVAEVLSGRTFSNASSVGLNGTMPNNGAVTLTPSTTDQAIPTGYHDGSGKCAGDADLVAGNIKNGVNLFGVNGSVIPASGNAAASDVLSGQTFSNASGAATGTMPNNGAVSITPGTSPQTIAAGYHSGSGTLAGDAGLVAGNIKAGVSIFGVPGTVQPPPLKTGQTTAYGTGSDGDLEKGASQSFTDNGNGTITDSTTGLVWEKKSDDGSVHDKDNNYSWGMRTSPYTMNGTIVTTFLATLNGGGGFAGHTDWRIPNRHELESIVNLENVLPAVSSAFNAGCAASCTVLTCSCTQSSYYWTSSTFHPPSAAWIVTFNDGGVYADDKSNSYSARAVRGGL